MIPYNFIKLSTWNVNGALSSAHEIEYLIRTNNIDVLLLSEPHMTGEKPLNIPGYVVYITPHPNGKSQGGAAVLINKKIRHFERSSYSTPHLQATTVTVQDKFSSLDISAVYCPPRHKITNIMFDEYFTTLGPRFISGGDWNAKTPIGDLDSRSQEEETSKSLLTQTTFSQFPQASQHTGLQTAKKFLILWTSL